LLDLKYAHRLGLAPSSIPAAMDTLFLEGPPLVDSKLPWRRSQGRLVLFGVGRSHAGLHQRRLLSFRPQTLAVGTSGLTGRLRATISGNVFDLLRSPELSWCAFPGEHTPGLVVRCRVDAA
jgi:hypothetical protein